MTDWNKLKLRTKLYQIKCCPSCGDSNLWEAAEGPRWVCNKCGVAFLVTNPSYLKRKKNGNTNSNNDSTAANR